MWHDEREIALSRLGLAKGQCARESARPGILGQGRGKTCRTGVGTCGGIGSPSSFARLKTGFEDFASSILAAKEGNLTAYFFRGGYMDTEKVASST